jgi:predicted amino acid dehydrogenase
MHRILHFVLGDSSQNLDKETEFLGKKVYLKRLGVHFDEELLKNLASNLHEQFDVVAVSGLGHTFKVGKKEVSHYLLNDVRSICYPTPVVDGQEMRKLTLPWAVNYLVKNKGNIFKDKKVGFFSGLLNQSITEMVSSLGGECLFADPYTLAKIPMILNGNKNLDSFLCKAKYLFKVKEIKELRGRKFGHRNLLVKKILSKFNTCEVFFLNPTLLNLIEMPDLKNKIVIVDRIDEKIKASLVSKNASAVYCLLPKVDSKEFSSFTLLEAFFQCLKEERTPLTSSDVEEYINDFSLKPVGDILYLSKKKNINRCAFVIHPLSRKYLLKAPGLKVFKNNKAVSQSLSTFVEKISPYIPPFKFGEIKGIKSLSTSQEVIVDVYAMTETPKALLSMSENCVYNKLVSICERAEVSGAQMIGLGAYTKVVGDAGVSVKKRSPIPLTTGNSLSAAATLWAGDYALKKMNLVPEVDKNFDGQVMIVGATGSIGKVNSKILCQKWKRVVISSPTLYKLVDLKEELEKINPRCEVIYTTNPNKFAGSSDFIITTTSAQGKRIIDIEKIKPGCVVCDVSRPFDISKEDAAKRPDILVIASGEVELPGVINQKLDIGLEGNSVYACLAETALLTMDNRFEAFSLGRDISYKKVFLIDQLARKHGVMLSSIMGHDQKITDEEITLCRNFAIEKRKAKINNPSEKENCEKMETSKSTILTKEHQ